MRPGLDFCNHSGSSACKWTVFGAEAAAGGKRLRRGEQPDAVSLVCPRKAVPRPGSEITINYGEAVGGSNWRSNRAAGCGQMCVMPSVAWVHLMHPAPWPLQPARRRQEQRGAALPLRLCGAGQPARGAALLAAHICVWMLAELLAARVGSRTGIQACLPHPPACPTRC